METKTNDSQRRTWWWLQFYTAVSPSHQLQCSSIDKYMSSHQHYTSTTGINARSRLSSQNIIPDATNARTHKQVLLVIVCLMKFSV